MRCDAAMHEALNVKILYRTPNLKAHKHCCCFAQPSTFTSSFLWHMLVWSMWRLFVKSQVDASFATEEFLPPFRECGGQSVEEG